MPEYPENPNSIMEDETRYALIRLPSGKNERVEFNRAYDCLQLFHEHHSPETVIETSQKKGAIYEGKYIVRMGDGAPYLYTEQELRELLHS